MKHKGAIIALMVLVCAVGLAAGYKYFRYAKEDPAYCAMCHRTQEGYSSHTSSVHYKQICQTCHSMTTMEGNRLILAYYVQGQQDIKQKHGRINPWNKCLTCHDNDVSQGSVTFRESYGHARHVFMHDMKCGQCHSGKMHEMQVSANKCRTCHKDKLVHGMGTAGLSCLNCHAFEDDHKKMQTSNKCNKCHKDLLKGPVMANLECHDCHQPHEKLKLNSQGCLGSCHSSETRVGQHKLHMDLENMECITCHRPHSWEVTKKKAPGLCDRCHRIKDPNSFIY